MRAGGDDGLKLAATLIEIVPYLFRSLVSVAEEKLHDGMTMQQFRVLGFLYYAPGSSLGDLAHWRDVSLPTMSKMVQCLVDRGLVIRIPDPENRRAIQITLTPTGEQVYIDVLKALQERIVVLLHDLTPAEQTAAIETLELLADAFADVGEVRRDLQLHPKRPK